MVHIQRHLLVIVVVALCLAGLVVGGVVFALGQWTPETSDGDGDDTADHADTAIFRDHGTDKRSQCTGLLPEAGDLDPVDPETAEQTHQFVIAAPEVVESLTLLEQSGTVVVWGEVLATEVGADHVHVQPLCLQRSEDDAEMILVRVVVAGSGVAGLGTSLDEALAEYATATGQD